MEQNIAFVRLALLLPLWELLESWATAPSFMLLLAVARVGQTMPAILAMKQRQQRRYTDFVDAVLPALLRGVYCPGLDCVASGCIQIDCGGEGFASWLSARLHLSNVDERPVEPLVRWCRVDGSGAFLEAWGLWNRPTPEWQTLATLLADPDVSVAAVRLFCPPPPAAWCLLVIVVCGNLRAALVFHREQVVHIDH